MLRCENVWKIFGPNAAAVLDELGPDASNATFQDRGLSVGVRNVNLTVEPGEIFVVMGLSGSGKSTLVRCMTGLYDLTAGAILVDDQDIARVSPKELVALRREKLSMVFQDFALLPHLTTIKNVEFPLRVQGVPARERQAKAREMIKLVGLEGKEDRYPDEMSGGQQQRVGIARSLTTQPEVWFLDEPFSALDPLIRTEMQAEFLRLQAMLQKSIVFITHDFEEAVRLADRMAIMKDGAVVQQGTPEDLVLNPADDYIREFTQAIPKQKVLRVRAVMQQGLPVGSAENPVPADARLHDVLSRVLQAEGAVGVVDAKGRVVGSVSRSDVLPVIL